MSIDVNGVCYVDVQVDGFEGLNFSNFLNLLTVESCGLKIPMLEVSVLQTTYKLAKSLNESNKVLTLTIGTSAKNAKTYEFLILNHAYSSYGNYLKLTFYCLCNIPSFMNEKRIQAFKNKASHQVLGAISSLKVVPEYTGSDVMTWIQHNNSDWDLADRVIDYAYQQADDCIVGSIIMEKELHVRSVRKLFSEGPVYTFTQSDYSSTKSKHCRIHRLYPESDSAVYSKLVSEGRVLPVQDAVKRKLLTFQIGTNSIAGSGNTNLMGSNVNIPTRYNNGNCHGNYFQAWLNNYNNSVQMNRDILYIVTNSSYINNDELQVGQLAEVIYNDSVHADMADPISGKYMVGEKCTRMSPMGFMHRFKLLRDYQG